MSTEHTAKLSSEDAVAAAAAHAEAVETSRAEHLDAFLESDKFAQKLEQAVVNGLGRGSKEKRYIDTGRIPFICEDISEIKKDLKTMSASLASYPIVKLLVFGFAGSILSGVLLVLGFVILNSVSHTSLNITL